MIYILVGPKGSGKTHIGKLIEQHFHIPFFHVEKLFVAIRRGRNVTDRKYHKEGYQELLKQLNKKRKVVIEQTGTGSYFHWLIRQLRKKHEVKLIRIDAPFKLCLKRIRKRDPTDQLPVSLAMLQEIHRQSKTTAIKYDMRIKNNDLSAAQILKKLKHRLVSA